MCSALALAAGCGTRMLLHMETKPLGNGLVLFEGGAGNSTALLHGDDVFLVDTKMGDFALRLQRELEEDGADRSVRRVLLTHAHVDHTLGLQRFHEVGVVLLQTNALRRMQARESSFLRDQTYAVVEDHVTLQLGGEEVRIFHPGVAHTDGDLCAYFPSRKLLIAGDLWNHGLEPEADFRYGGNILALRKAYDVLLALDFDKVIPGHGSVGTKADVQRNRDYLMAMEAAVWEAIRRGDTEEDAVKKVTMAEWPEYDPVPFYATRELNVRMMYRTLKTGPDSAHE
ncbi:MAG: MBL fold metallo-hydrolase [Myxococcaceae bacterium]